MITKYVFDRFTGREMITTDYREVTPNNVIDILNNAMTRHRKNCAEITYLYNYYCGNQDVRDKSKAVREEINNKVCENRANEIVTFKTAFLLAQPIQYIASGDVNETVSGHIKMLNEFMRLEDKESLDKETADWVYICGVAPRMVIRDDDINGEEYGSPFTIYSIDPREGFVIYHSGLGNRPLAGVIIQRDEDRKTYYCVYTKDFYCEIKDDEFKLSPVPHIIGRVPVVEYISNKARMGAFEAVLPLLNALNQSQSDRVDSIQDFVNAYDVFQNCDIDGDTYKQLAHGGGGIKIKTTVPGMEAKVYRIASELSQTGVETTVEDIRSAITEICGMPNRNGGSSTSDTGSAVIFRDGWSEAESRAKDTEKLWNKSERELLKIILALCPTQLPITISDIQIEWTRKNLSNLQSKVQALCELLNNNKIHPKDAYAAVSGLFVDTEQAYKNGMEWYEEQQSILEKQLEESKDDGTDNQDETEENTEDQQDNDAESNEQNEDE